MKYYRIAMVGALVCSGCIGTANIVNPAVTANVETQAQSVVSATEFPPVTLVMSTPTPAAQVSPVATSIPTPIPTPTPTATPTPFPKVHFRIAVIRGDGTIVPVAKTVFFVAPYSKSAVRAKLAVTNNAPVEPQLTDSQNQYCPSSTDPSYCTPDMRVFRTRHDSWEATAFIGEHAADTAASNGRFETSFTTDLNGEADAVIDAGSWFLSGYYSLASSSIAWNDVALSIDSSHLRFEISNSDGVVTRY
jgi:hypothetical protein